MVLISKDMFLPIKYVEVSMIFVAVSMFSGHIMFFETVKTVLSDDDMVRKGDPKHIADIFQFFCEKNVGIAGRAVS